MVLLKFFLITLLVLYLIRIIFRLVFPVMLAKMFGKVVERAQNQSAEQKRKPEGSISIDYMPPKTQKKGNSDKLGDFVDYEEVR